MTIKLTGRLVSALAIGLVAVFAAASPVAADESTAVSSPSDTSRGLSLGQAQAAANDEAATSQEAQPAADPQAAQPSAGMTQQAESPSPATSAQVAANDDNAGWDTTALIGKVLIGVGTLLTLGSAARMLMS